MGRPGVFSDGRWLSEPCARAFAWHLAGSRVVFAGHALRSSHGLVTRSFFTPGPPASPSPPSAFVLLDLRPCPPLSHRLPRLGICFATSFPFFTLPTVRPHSLPLHSTGLFSYSLRRSISPACHAGAPFALPPLHSGSYFPIGAFLTHSPPLSLSL